MNCSSIIWQQSSVGTVWLWLWCVVRGKNVSASDCIKILPPLSQIWSAIYKLYSPAQEHAAYCQSSSSTHVTTNTTTDHIISDTISNIHKIHLSEKLVYVHVTKSQVSMWGDGYQVWLCDQCDHLTISIISINCGPASLTRLVTSSVICVTKPIHHLWQV